MPPVANRNFHRVSKREPCLVCGKPDWCMHSNDGEACICARVPEGSVKEITSSGNFVGYLHRLKEREKKPVFVPKPITAPNKFGARDWPTIASECIDAADADRMRLLANSLDLTLHALVMLDVGWISKERLATLDTGCYGEGCWTFPMKDHRSNVVGVRLRSRDKKYAITGSDGNGIFDLQNHEDPRLVIVEGPTSAAAMFDLGFSVIGRSSCTGSVANCMERANRKDVIIYADSDEEKSGRRAGKEGAEALARKIVQVAKTVRVMQCVGEKDVRAMKTGGATRDVFEILISQQKYWIAR